ncbi:hypothetical protein ABZS98_27710 [Streptomyces avermitilis]|uniref:hypothetical protein n=1 Tax=Streptomyces avermitilis TaxID=33903 RepID=UPI0033B55C1B
MPDGLLSFYRCFPSAKREGSRPLGISPPTEGSLDRETWNRLIEILAEHSPAGADTRCLAYCNPLMLRDTDFDNLHVRVGRLGAARISYDNPEVDFSPSNLWAEDHSGRRYRLRPVGHQGGRPRTADRGPPGRHRSVMRKHRQSA